MTSKNLLPAAAKQRPGWVYFIQQNENGPVKVGWSRNVDKRLQSLNHASPENYRIRRVVFGTMELEKAIHRKLKPLHIRGEWFRVNEALNRLMNGRSYELMAGMPPFVKCSYYSLPEVFEIQAQMDREPLGHWPTDGSALEDRLDRRLAA